MFRTTLKNLAARKLRLLTTSIAVLLGVAFMAGTLVLTDTINSSFDDLFASANAGTNVYVRPTAAFASAMGDDARGRLDESVVAKVRNVEGVAAAEGYTEAYAQLVDTDGKVVGNPGMGAPVLGASWVANDDLNPFDIAAGRAPRADREVVLDRGSADKAHYGVGDTATVLTKTGRQSVTVVGIATFAGLDSPGGASFTLFTPHAAQELLTEPGKVDAVKVLAEPGVSDEDLAERVSSVVPEKTDVLTGAQITAEQKGEVEDGLQFITVFLLVFAVIALFVGSFIIYNSFSILVAQRSKEMALMRAIGAGRRQVLGSVLIEAVAVGVLASAAGLAAGIGVASLLKSLFNSVGVEIPPGSVVITPRTIVVSLVVGLGVSVASAVFPARRASKVPPIAAMRDVALDTSGSSRGRLVAGTATTLLGGGALAAGLFAGAGAPLVGLGAALVFVGVAVLGPILARPLSQVLGYPVARLRGTPGNLARENAMRNPKRTSATAAALMIGVALVGFITILASSTKASINESVDKTFNGDLVVSGGVPGIGGLNPKVAIELAKLPETGAITGVRMAPVQIGTDPALVTGADPAALQQIVDLDVRAGSFDQLDRNGIAVLDDVARSHHWKVGDSIPVQFTETGVQQLRLAATYDEGLTVGEYVVGLPAFEANVADQLDSRILMDAADGTSLEQARHAVERVTDAYPQAEVQDKVQYREAMTKNVGMMLGLIYILLGLAVLIALLGIANTLALSILERTRELGLLRAVGMSRRQLRATVRYESVIIALLGTTLGLAIGIGFGWAMVRALADQGLGTFTLPATQMVVVAIIAAVAGVMAAVLPARRAARLDILGAITSD